MLLCLFMELTISGSAKDTAAAAFTYGKEHKSGGGFFGGLFTGILLPAFGLIGSYAVSYTHLQKLMDYNMILVVYLFPALLKQNQRSGEAFAKALLQEWKQAFPKTNLHLASYEEIAEGFRQRFCYITTAVCQSLNKGDNCEELVLLRGYRDGYLMGLPGGQRVIQEYYDVAPTIVKQDVYKRQE